MSCKITIHRGTHQIGGCVTEITTDTSRIFIDFGSELPGPDGEKPKETLRVAGLTDSTVPCDGVFFTHTHGDHIGNIGLIPETVPLFLGATSQEISLVISQRLQKAHDHFPEKFDDQSATITALNRANTFSMGEKIPAGEFYVTPLRVDHSAFDSYMFIVEAQGVRILHTGDFRDHGYTGDELIPALEEYATDIDWLICEGTMLSRPNEGAMTEEELQHKAQKLMAGHRHIFVFCSSTNIDRIRAFYKAKPKIMPAVCDAYQRDVLDVVKKFDTTEDDSYHFKYVIPYPEKEYQHNPKLLDWMEEQGFLMFVRNKDFFREFMEQYRDDCLVIYSMWKGYLEGKAKNQKIVDFLDGYSYKSLHTSGHATAAAIRKVYDIVKPRKGVIPIHSEAPEKIQEILPIEVTIKLLNDKDYLYLN